MSLVLYFKSRHHIQSHLGVLLLYSRRFLVFAFICMLTHFELIFVCVIRSLSSFFFFPPSPSLDCSSIIYYEDYFLSVAFPLLFCQRSVNCRLFLGPLSYSIDLPLKLRSVGPPTLSFSFIIM